MGFAQPDLLSAPCTCACTHMHVCACVLLSLSLSNVTPNLQQGTSSGVQPQKHLYVLMFEEKKKKKLVFLVLTVRGSIEIDSMGDMRFA